MHRTAQEWQPSPGGFELLATGTGHAGVARAIEFFPNAGRRGGWLITVPVPTWRAGEALALVHSNLSGAARFPVLRSSRPGLGTARTMLSRREYPLSWRT